MRFARIAPRITGASEMTMAQATRDQFGNLSVTTDYPMGDAKDSMGRVGQRVMRVTSRKDSYGNLRTSAICGIQGQHSFSVAYGLAGGGDFTRDIIKVPGRATAKALEAQHAKALESVPALLAEAGAYYTKQTA